MPAATEPESAFVLSQWVGEAISDDVEGWADVTFEPATSSDGQTFHHAESNDFVIDAMAGDDEHFACQRLGAADGAVRFDRGGKRYVLAIWELPQ